MAQITTKELGAIGDALAVEQTLITKYRYYASLTEDALLRHKYDLIADRHQKHYDELYSHLR